MNLGGWMAPQRMTEMTCYVSLGAPIIDPNWLTITPLLRSRDCLSWGQPHVRCYQDRNLEPRWGGAAPGPPRLSPGRVEHRKFSRTHFMPPEVVTVFTQTINKYGTSLTFHWIILALSGLSEGYQCPCRYFIARLNKIWTIYSHFNGLQPYNAVFLEPNKSFDSPPLLDADARTLQAPHTYS